MITYIVLSIMAARGRFAPPELVDILLVLEVCSYMGATAGLLAFGSHLGIISVR